MYSGIKPLQFRRSHSRYIMLYPCHPCRSVIVVYKRFTEPREKWRREGWEVFHWWKCYVIIYHVIYCLNLSSFVVVCFRSRYVSICTKTGSDWPLECSLSGTSDNMLLFLRFQLWFWFRFSFWDWNWNWFQFWFPINFLFPREISFRFVFGAFFPKFYVKKNNWERFWKKNIWSSFSLSSYSPVLFFALILMAFSALLLSMCDCNSTWL